jgi:hypothetical protein
VREARRCKPPSGFGAHRVGVAPRVHHRPPGRQAIRMHPVLDTPAAPATPALTSARWPDALRRHPAEQQPGQPPHRSASGRTHTPGACYASPPRHSEQAVPLAGLLRVVLHGLREVLVEGHGLPPGNDCPPAFAARFWLSHCRSREAALRYMRPANCVGWLFLVAGPGLGLGGFANAYRLPALVAPGSLPAAQRASGCRLGGPGPRLRAGC